MTVTKGWEFAPRFLTRSGRALADTSTFRQSVLRGIGHGKVSVVVSIVILAVAIAVLYHLLHDIDLSKVVEAIEDQSRVNILIAGALVVAGYANLICYDLFALETIGKRHIPLRVVSFASFTSYTIGHSLGAATVTCGLVRFRVYSFWNLTLIDITKIAFMTGMTFWLGNAFVLGTTVSYAPSALTSIDQLPDTLNRALAVATLCAVAVYVGWLVPRQRIIGWSGWRITLPSARRTLLQIGIGTLDRCLASLSLFMLLPASPSVSFVNVMVVFVVATLLGAASHTPGSLGVVEATILIGLPEYPREQLLAAVLTFRVLDFFLPLFIAMLMFGAREIRLLMRRDDHPGLARGTPPP
jgi:uncharacterized membrane protein YbhN (UPF0104 family)